MTGEPDQEMQLKQLRALSDRQGSNLNLLGERAKAVEPRAVFRVWGVALLLAMLAGSMGTWMIVPFYAGSGNLYPSGAFGYSLWDIPGAVGETVTGETVLVILLLFLVLALGMAALATPGPVRPVVCGGAAVLLLAAEIWLRIEIGDQAFALNDYTSGTTTYYHPFGGGALTLTFVFTAAVALWSFDGARRFRD